MIEVKDLVFSYEKGRKALKGLDFEVEKGEIFGFLGPNGSGKSTTQKILTGIQGGSEGEVRLMGKTPDKTDRKVFYQEIGVLFEFPYLYTNLSALDNLKFFSSFYSRERRRDIMPLLERLEFKMDYLKKPVASYSKGMRQRVSMARALLGNPDILFLDEPTSGLDPGERVRFRNLLSEFAADRIVLISTHIVSDVEYIASQNAVMKEGRIIAEGTTEELLRQMNGKVWSAFVPEYDLHKYEQGVRIVSIRNEDAGVVSVRYLAERPVLPESEAKEPRLEDLYLWLFPQEKEVQ